MADPVRLPPRSFEYEALKAALEAAITGDPTFLQFRYNAAVTALLGGVVTPPVPAPSFTLSSALALVEGDTGTKVFQWVLTLSRDGSTAAIPYNWAVTGSGANPADPNDFGGVFPTGSGTFAAGETVKFIPVLVTGDTAFEPNDSFTLTVNGLNTVTSTGTITNDDPVPATPTVTLSGSQSKFEGNSGATLFTYTVSRSAAVGAVNVPWSFLAGSTSADDFTGGVFPAGGNVALADGVLSGTFVVSANGDDVPEGDDSFTVMISTPSGYVAGAATSASGTILNDDAAVTKWRTVSANMIGQAAGSGNNKLGDWHAFRQAYPIGSGDVSHLRYAAFNWFSASGVQNLYTTQLIIPAMYVVANGVPVQATQNGNTTITIEPGANRVFFDTLLPSQFGLTQFTRGSMVLLRGVCYRPGVVTSVPVSQTIQIQSDTTNSESMWFDGALGVPTNLGGTSGTYVLPSYTGATASYSGTVATIAVGSTNPLPSVGALIAISGATPSGFNGSKTITSVDTSARTFSYTVASGLAAPTGTISYVSAKYAQATAFRPVLEGRFVSGDPPTLLFFGDSIDVGLNQGAAAGGPLGIGRNAQASHDPGALTNFTAYMSIAVGGSVVDQFTGTNDLTWPWMSLCRGATGAFLTNSFALNGTSLTPAQMLSRMQLFWAKLREMGVEKILALSGQTRGSSTNGFTSEDQQTIAAGWLAGGNVEQYYALMPDEISAGRITDFLNFESWRGTDRYKWKVDPTSGAGSSDGTHPASWVHNAEGIEVRSRLTANGMLA
jgi:hypothetical protein